MRAVAAPVSFEERQSREDNFVSQIGNVWCCLNLFKTVLGSAENMSKRGHRNILGLELKQCIVCLRGLENCPNQSVV
jgi:hypothetical protein